MKPVKLAEQHTSRMDEDVRHTVEAALKLGFEVRVRLCGDGCGQPAALFVFEAVKIRR